MELHEYKNKKKGREIEASFLRVLTKIGLICWDSALNDVAFWKYTLPIFLPSITEGAPIILFAMA